MKTFVSVLTTARPRESQLLGETLTSLDLGGAADLPRAVFLDGPLGGELPSRRWDYVGLSDTQQGNRAAMWALFRAVLEHDFERLIYCEDDILVCKNAVTFASRVKLPPQAGFTMLFASHDEIWRPGRAPGFYVQPIVPGKPAKSAQFLILPRASVEFLVSKDPFTVIGGPSERQSGNRAMSDLLAPSPWPFYSMLRPSIALHVAEFSVAHPERTGVLVTEDFSGHDFDALSLGEQLPIYENQCIGLPSREKRAMRAHRLAREAGERRVIPREIPKVFHRIWIGGKPMPEVFQRFGQTWLDHHPGWTMKIWTEANLPEIRNRDIYDRCIHLSQKSDVLRYEILLREGGVYLDTDFECLRNIEPLIDGKSAFAAYRENREGERRSKGFGSSIFGSVAGHPLLRELVEKLPAVDPRESLALGPNFFTRYAETYPDVAGLPAKWFYPISWWQVSRDGPRQEAFGDAYAVHHWSSKWFPPSFELLDGGGRPRNHEQVSTIDENKSVLISVLTTERAKSYLTTTLESLERNGAYEVSRAVFSDGPCGYRRPDWDVVELSSERRGTRQSAWSIFRAALDRGVERLIYCEDDIVLCRNAISYLAKMALPEGQAFVTCLDHRDWLMRLQTGIHAASFGDGRLLGSQLLVFSRKTLEYLVSLDPMAVINSHPWYKDGRHSVDMVIGKILRDGPWKSYGIHVPALGQHLGDVSAAHPDRNPAKPVRTKIFAGLSFDALTLLQ